MPNSSRPSRNAATAASDAGFSTIENRPDEPVIVALPKRVARMIGQGGVDDAQDLGPVAEPLRQRQSLTLRLAQPRVHGAQAAQRKKDVLGAGRDRHQVDRW